MQNLPIRNADRPKPTGGLPWIVPPLSTKTPTRMVPGLFNVPEAVRVRVPLIVNVTDELVHVSAPSTVTEPGMVDE